MFSVVGLITYLDDNWVIQVDYLNFKIQYQVGELFIGFQNKSIPN
jgi:hypothetical protein